MALTEKIGSRSCDISSQSTRRYAGSQGPLSRCRYIRYEWWCYTNHMGVMVHIDVPDQAGAIAFYTAAFGLSLTQRLDAEIAALSGWPARLDLPQKPPGSLGAAGNCRRYVRYWTPVHRRDGR